MSNMYALVWDEKKTDDLSLKNKEDAWPEIAQISMVWIMRIGVDEHQKK